MRTVFGSKIKLLKSIVRQFDLKSNDCRLSILTQLAEKELPPSNILKNYFEVLLFICAYPPNKKTLAAAKQELARIPAILKKSGNRSNNLFINSGLPFTQYVSSFSYDFVQWLLAHSDCKISLNRFENALFDLKTVLKITLPSLERSETTAGLGNEELLDSLQIKKEKRLKFILNELDKPEIQSAVVDHFFDGLGIYIDIIPKNKYFSRGYNHIAPHQLFFHSEILRKFNHQSLISKKIPEATNLTISKKKKIISVVKKTMALTDRETDPVTYMDENTFRLYELERGIAIAIYGIRPERQLPIESYVGYTLFKNGFPAVYGGAWVFGKWSNFGINIFETFRGGESGYMLCQLLRVFKQVFKINYFEIEPYQFGLDNPEGIESGAFWFYYRYGFRPVENRLLKIADSEFNKITKSKNYHTSKKILKKFTESNLALNIEGKKPVGVYDIVNKILAMIRVQYHGNRQKAELACIAKFKRKTGLNISLNSNETQVLKELALWSEAFKITEPGKLKLLRLMIKIKPADLYQYQRLLLRFLQ